MKYEQVIEHINRKYSNGTDRATFLVRALMRRSQLKSETESAIVQILNTPICTGVIFGQLARNYLDYKG